MVTTIKYYTPILGGRCDFFVFIGLHCMCCKFVTYAMQICNTCNARKTYPRAVQSIVFQEAKYNRHALSRVIDITKDARLQVNL